jgi:hypothetical protein
MPQVVAMAAEHTPLVLHGENLDVGQFACALADKLDWDDDRVMTTKEELK